MRNPIECDKCKREAPRSYCEALELGWYFSSKLSSAISDIVMCPECIKNHNNIINNNF